MKPDPDEFDAEREEDERQSLEDEHWDRKLHSIRDGDDQIERWLENLKGVA